MLIPRCGYSETTYGTPLPSQRRAILHRGSGTYTSEYSGEHQWEGQVVEYFPAWGLDRRRHLSGVVAEEVL